MITKTVTEIDYREFEALVKNTYPGAVRYNFVAVEECGNDSTHVFEVLSKDPLNEDDLELMRQWESGGFVKYSNYLLFQDLVNKDVLQPAEYIVSVSW